VVLDLGLPPHPEDTSEGIRLLERIIQKNPVAKIIVVTGNPDRTAAIQAISKGAHDFFTKPIDLAELKHILKRAYHVSNLEIECRELQKQLEQRTFGEIVGLSPGMQDVFATVRKVATTDVPVLITGESGTGKELTAHAIHNQSLRKKGPFVPINCGAIPENLMESELFGYEKGSFTGAHIQRKGRIELAEGGTLFLDEIGDLPLSLQVKILRFLQENTIERIGGRETHKIDCRIIAASNRDIKKMVSDGQFREDLYYRMAVVTVDLPPLRERGEDIFLLAKSFLKKFSTERSRPFTLNGEAIEALNAYEWPGNIRQLENRVRRALTLAEGPAITPADLGFQAEDVAAQLLDLKKAREALEVKYIRMAIIKHDGNISKAAGDLGLSRPAVHYMMKKYNIRIDKRGNEASKESLTT
jgi:two-component system NtrC family response regulator